MFSELITESDVLILRAESYDGAVAELLSTRPPELRGDLATAFERARLNPHAFLGSDIALPHARVTGLGRAELMLGISAKGIEVGGRKPHIILLLATPDERPAAHLQFLQGLSSLLRATSEALRTAERPDDVLDILRSTEANLRPSFINLTQEQVAFELQSDLTTGLSSVEAGRRLQHYGPNEITRMRALPWYARLAGNLFSFFAVLLWAAAALCFVPGVDMPQLGWAIIIVIVLNGLFAFLQQYRSDRAVESLQRLMTPTCRVQRDGALSEVRSPELVPGDIISLEEGDIVPADARIIEANGLEIDNSSLTGESTSAKRYKSDRPVLIEGRFLWIEMPNIVFAGSSVLRGNARAVVFGTGMNTEIGKIAGITQSIRQEPSPLEKQLRGTVYAIAALAFTLGIALLILGRMVAGLEFLQAFVFFIGIFVANVPEGLLPTVTLSLAMGVNRMARRNAIVKNLSAVETLGCTTVICSDKTGTLTQNLMMVTELYVDGAVIRIEGRGFEREARFMGAEGELIRTDLSRQKTLQTLLECAHICNNARLTETGATLAYTGDPTEGALLVLAARAGVRGTHHRIHQNPFESVRKRMSVVCRRERGDERIAFMKGAPLEVLPLCTHIAEAGNIRPMTETDRKQIRDRVDSMANRGLRVLGFSFRDDEALQTLEDLGVEQLEADHVFLGISAMSDPVRPGVPEAIAACHGAGIRVIMITGDYPLTAQSIARDIGIGGAGGSSTVLTGVEISSKSDAELKEVLATGEPIFARVSPEQKLRIVTLLRELGEVTAVTGDGVNDGPALRRADIGIAMGMRGTDVAKEAAQIILVDDNFASIVAAIEEGRAVFDNIKRFVGYIFNSNPQELYPYILWMLVPGYPLAMTVMGVLAVDVGTDLIPAMGLGLEPPEKGVMRRPPRPRSERLLSLPFILRAYFVQGSILAFSCFATYYFFAWFTDRMSAGFSWFAPPPSPPQLRMDQATREYLMSLSAFFFPTITTQIGNVMCKRSREASLFSREFLTDAVRASGLERLRTWKPAPYRISVSVEASIGRFSGRELTTVALTLLGRTLLLPLQIVRLATTRILVHWHRPLWGPLLSWLARFFGRHYILYNFVSNPLINLGILFELTLAFAFFYTDLSHLYYFAPIPWQVILFAFHGTVLIIAFEEVRKALLRAKRRKSP